MVSQIRPGRVLAGSLGRELSWDDGGDDLPGDLGFCIEIFLFVLHGVVWVGGDSLGDLSLEKRYSDESDLCAVKIVALGNSGHGRGGSVWNRRRIDVHFSSRQTRLGDPEDDAKCGPTDYGNRVASFV